MGGESTSVSTTFLLFIHRNNKKSSCNFFDNVVLDMTYGSMMRRTNGDSPHLSACLFPASPLSWWRTFGDCPLLSALRTPPFCPSLMLISYHPHKKRPAKLAGLFLGGVFRVCRLWEACLTRLCFYLNEEKKLRTAAKSPTVGS